MFRSLFGCRHARTTFPLSPSKGPRAGTTYVACLDCGKEFGYDWPSMRPTGELKRPTEVDWELLTSLGGKNA